MQNQVNSFKNIRILYTALAAGQIMISLVIVFLNSDATLDMSFGDIKQLLVLLLVPGAIMISHYLYSNKTREGKKLNGFEDKLMHYREANILRWALVEGVNLINIVFFFISKNYFFLILFLFGLVFFLLARPSEEGFVEDYKLNFEEKQELKESMKK